MNEEIGMVPLFLRDVRHAVHEDHRFLEIGESEGAGQPGLVRYAPLRHLLRKRSDCLAFERRLSPFARYAMLCFQILRHGLSLAAPVPLFGFGLHPLAHAAYGSRYPASF